MPKEHVYNREKNPKNPMVSMRIKNNTGLILERGPIVILEDNTYVGEAILPYTVKNGEASIPYSIDMGVVVTENASTTSTFNRVYIDGIYLMRENYDTLATEYTIENKNSTPVDLVLEHRKIPNYVLVDTPPTSEETENYYRWKFNVKPKSMIKFVVKQRTITHYSEEIRNLSIGTIEWYYNENKITKKDYEWFRKIIELRMRFEELQRKIATLDVEYNRIFTDQQRIRENLKALGTSGREETLRRRYVDLLDDQENRLNQIQVEKDKINSEIIETEHMIANLLDEVIEIPIKKVTKQA
jgi:hypothetical protein